MTTAQFADKLRVAGIQNSAKPYKLTTGAIRYIVDVSYPEDRQHVIDLAAELGLTADIVKGAEIYGNRRSVRVAIDGLTLP